MLVDCDLQFNSNKSGETIAARQFLVPLLIGNGQAGLVITYNATSPSSVTCFFSSFVFVFVLVSVDWSDNSKITIVIGNGQTWPLLTTPGFCNCIMCVTIYLWFPTPSYSHKLTKPNLNVPPSKAQPKLSNPHNRRVINLFVCYARALRQWATKYYLAPSGTR